MEEAAILAPEGAVAAGDVRRFLTYRLALVDRRLAHHAERYFSAEVGLTVAEWRVVAVLGSGGPTTATLLAERAIIDPGQNSRVMAALVQRALLSTKPDPVDARRKLVRLTPDGLALFRRAMPHAIDRQRELLAVLSPVEIEVMDRVLDKLAHWSAPEAAHLVVDGPAA